LSQFTCEPNSDKRTLAEFNFPPRVYPLGRLDYDSEGLLLLSDDGSMNKVLLDPANAHKRTYLVQVENVPTEDSLEKLEKGIILQGEKTLPCRAKLLNEEPDLPPRDVPIRFRKNIPTAWLKLTIAEGKNRQVRRMTAAIGYPTLRLVRVAIGNLTLEELELQPGKWARLKADQVEGIF
jgi:23S rRNA pseudouridine2457 synthase